MILIAPHTSRNFDEKNSDVMHLQVNRLLPLHVVLISVFVVCFSVNNYSNAKSSDITDTKKQLCVSRDDAIRAKRKKCLLRPDTGPCRADILTYYYDAKQQRCYRFFYGGCQGNGNNFKTRKECMEQCLLKAGADSFHRPYFCSLAFDFGTCFGQYIRFGWDPVAEVCRQRIYSGCGGNQNNFETKTECMATCLYKPNNTMSAAHQRLTTCIPILLNEFN